MLAVHHLSKSYNLDTVLKDVTFTLSPGERLGLVGANGSGKSTLLRILVGLERADQGVVQWTPPEVRVGYLPQGFLEAQAATLEEYLASPAETAPAAQSGAASQSGAAKRRMAGGSLDSAAARVEHLAAELAASPDSPDLQQAYDLALSALVQASATAARLPEVLAALGLDGCPLDQPLDRLSGGQKTRLALARLLLAMDQSHQLPQVLLLDEPTNHLDQEMLEWLEGWLAGFTGAILVASHDRTFLDRITTAILELDPTEHTARKFAADGGGSYSAYLEQKQAERQRQWQEYQDQNDEISRLRRAASHLRSIAQFHKGGKADTGDGFARGFFANRGLETVGRAKNIERRLERLLGEDRVEKPRPGWQMRLEFGGRLESGGAAGETPESGRDVVVLEDLSVGYAQENGGPVILLSAVNAHLRYGDHTVLTGPNGTGKTTLLRTIAGQLPALHGQARLGSGVQPGYMAQEQENLDHGLTPIDTVSRLAALNETALRSFLSLYLFTGDDVFVPVGSLSYGERSRLALACLVARGCNLLLLDEPINHLDIPSRTRFEQALSAFQGTILTVVHDRYFIEGFARQIWEVRDGTLNTWAV
jgi:ATPase subunit of ABC transporter with duplicated ATPase domains